MGVDDERPDGYSDREWRDWQRRRGNRDAEVRRLQAAGQCYQCHDQLLGGTLLGRDTVIARRGPVQAALSADPRAPGHTIVGWLPHVQDFLGLDEAETATLFTAAREVGLALREAVGCERVYLVTMSDGELNHLHLQLIPRYAGTPIGSRRLLDPRRPLRGAAELTAAVRTRLGPTWTAPS
ncbi:HIT family protein [Microlunatus speluncae]|uniref:HIT family protein n=1 Tax=Microlunatus speluncae TaxID=2594267 RepID=UPI0012667574|nr:HIT family protein [Microlunatus speluncae]